MPEKGSVLTKYKNRMSQNEPEITANPWMQHMMQGAFEAAWKYSDEVLQSHAGKPCWHLPRHQQYIWDGSPLRGKRVLVRCYHGLGDTIQFIRFVPLVKEIAAEVIVWAQPQLIPLLQSMEGIDQLLPLHNGTPDVAYDVDVEVMELPHIFRTTLATLPSQVPYLHAAPIALPFKEKPAVGLIWKSGNWNENRSVPFALLLPFFKIKNLRFYILQQDAEGAGWQEGCGTLIGGNDVLEDAQIIRSLDLLISVDTMTAHLAGALGVPVWNLLQASADWRWMAHRPDSPWYPTMRLFRQAQQGAWQPVIEQVTTELEKLIPKNPTSNNSVV